MTAQLSRVSLIFGGFWWRLGLRVAAIGALAGVASVILAFQMPHAASLTDIASGTAWGIALMLVLYVLVGLVYVALWLGRRLFPDDPTIATLPE